MELKKHAGKFTNSVAPYPISSMLCRNVVLNQKGPQSLHSVHLKQQADMPALLLMCQRETLFSVPSLPIIWTR